LKRETWEGIQRKVNIGKGGGTERQSPIQSRLKKRKAAGKSIVRGQKRGKGEGRARADVLVGRWREGLKERPATCFTSHRETSNISFSLHRQGKG